MRKFKHFFAVLALFILASGITSFTLQTAGNSHVNGGGTTMENGEKSTFVFNAVEHEDGSVTGHLNYKFRSGDIEIQMDIDCMTINGNRATLNGAVTQVTGNTAGFPFITVGARAAFTVQDNGQGKGTSDLISDLLFGSSCAANLVTYLPISGNISIKE